MGFGRFMAFIALILNIGLSAAHNHFSHTRVSGISAVAYNADYYVSQSNVVIESDCDLCAGLSRLSHSLAPTFLTFIFDADDTLKNHPIPSFVAIVGYSLFQSRAPPEPFITLT